MEWWFKLLKLELKTQSSERKILWGTSVSYDIKWLNGLKELLDEQVTTTFILYFQEQGI